MVRTDKYIDRQKEGRVSGRVTRAKHALSRKGVSAKSSSPPPSFLRPDKKTTAHSPVGIPSSFDPRPKPFWTHPLR